MIKDRPGKISESYSGRSKAYVVVNRQMEREAAELMAKFAPTIKAQGRFLSRLIYEHEARMVERQRWEQSLKGMLTSDVTADETVDA